MRFSFLNSDGNIETHWQLYCRFIILPVLQDPLVPCCRAGPAGQGSRWKMSRQQVEVDARSRQDHHQAGHGAHVSPAESLRSPPSGSSVLNRVVTTAWETEPTCCGPVGWQLGGKTRRQATEARWHSGRGLRVTWLRDFGQPTSSLVKHCHTMWTHLLPLSELKNNNNDNQNEIYQTIYFR